MVKESAQLVSEQWRIQGKDTGGGGAPPLFLDQTEAGKLFRWPPPPLLLI